MGSGLRLRRAGIDPSNGREIRPRLAAAAAPTLCSPHQQQQRQEDFAPCSLGSKLRAIWQCSSFKFSPRRQPKTGLRGKFEVGIASRPPISQSGYDFHSPAWGVLLWRRSVGVWNVWRVGAGHMLISRLALPLLLLSLLWRASGCVQLAPGGQTEASLSTAHFNLLHPMSMTLARGIYSSEGDILEYKPEKRPADYTLGLSVSQEEICTVQHLKCSQHWFLVSVA